MKYFWNLEELKQAPREIQDHLASIVTDEGDGGAKAAAFLAERKFI